MKKRILFFCIFSFVFIAGILAQTSSTADELTKLKKLYDQGVLTKEEFEGEKAKLLGKPISTSKSTGSVTNSDIKEKITINEAEFSGTVVFVKDNNTGVELQTSRMSLKTRVQAIAFVTSGLAGKAKSKATVKGTASSVSISPMPIFQFIYTSENNSKNPSEIITLYKFKINGSDREIELASAGIYGNVDVGSNDFTVPITAIKYGTKSYLITVKNLEPGEYGFVFNSDIQEKSTTTLIRCFSVR